VLDGDPGIERRKLQDILKRLKALMANEDGPKRMVVRGENGPDFAVVRLPDKTIVKDTSGTRGIDVIHSAVAEFCENRGWRITELGICVDKPGEHGYCNAWDGGIIRDNTGRLLASSTIHQRIMEVATFLRNEGVKYASSGGRYGLPVNGVICMSVYWERGMSASWRHYNGTPHVTHWHVSAHPSYTGWV
jgi:hypothetical protein